MKNLNVSFEDAEFEILQMYKERAGKLSWHDYIIAVCAYGDAFNKGYQDDGK